MIMFMYFKDRKIVHLRADSHEERDTWMSVITSCLVQKPDTPSSGRKPLLPPPPLILSHPLIPRPKSHKLLYLPNSLFSGARGDSRPLSPIMDESQRRHTVIT